MHSRPAEQQSNWQLLNTFWSTLGQSHAPLAQERMPYDTQLLDYIADKYRDNCLIALSRDSFNRQERCYTKIARFYAMSDSEAEQDRKDANTTGKEIRLPSIAHGALPEHELDKRWMLRNYGLVLHLHAQLTSNIEDVCGARCGYTLAPLVKTNHKRVPMNSTFLWSVAVHVLNLY